MNYVLDAQTALAWHYVDEANPETEALLEGFNAGNSAAVPTIFQYEVANSLAVNERKAKPRSTPAQSTAFLQALKLLPIEVDEESGPQAGERTIELARMHKLSVYDAAYLELALRKNLALATRDPLLAPAAKKAGVRLILKSILLAGFASLLGLAPLRSLQAADEFQPTPYHSVQPSVPTGTLTQHTNWHSLIFTNTVRDWWVYVPAQYRADQPACVMIFQDGHDYVGAKGSWRVPIVFDNLIAKGEMPVTIAILINPGHNPQRPTPASPWQASNRSVEYDSLGDRYARMLVDEILPEVGQRYNLTKNPEGRAICGASSGGICSFTVAWERPDQFRKVLSTIGSFVDLRGGHVYPYLIRKTERKPIRIFLEDAAGDLDNPFGNWPLANQMMASSLKYMKYDVRFDYVPGFGHNSKHGGSIFPEALKWLWRDYQP